MSGGVNLEDGKEETKLSPKRILENHGSSVTRVFNALGKITIFTPVNEIWYP